MLKKILLFPMLLGCAPMMQYSTTQSYTFAAAEHCSQGPYEYTLTTKEAEYGQSLFLSFSEGASPSQLHYRIELDGSLLQQGLLGTTEHQAGTDSQGNPRYEPYTPPSPCLSPEEAKASPSPNPNNSNTPSTKPPVASGPPAVAIKPPVKELPNDSPKPSGAREIELDLKETPAGKTIRVLLWSDLPYHFDQAWLRVSLESYSPKDVAKYEAWQKKQDEKDQKRSARYQEQDQKRSARHQEKSQKKSEEQADVSARERRRALRIVAKYEPRWKRYLEVDQAFVEREAKAATPEEKKKIQVEHYNAFVDAYNDAEKAYFKLSKLNDPETLAKFSASVLTPAREQQLMWAKVVPTLVDAPTQVAQNEPKPTPPPGPPPLPWAEERGLAPMEGATWRSGYWRWNGFYWVWYAGDWELPKVAAKTTTTVAAAPPAPKVEEVPAPPAPDYVWINGAWRWDGSVYIWVKGTWKPMPTNQKSAPGKGSNPPK